MCQKSENQQLLINEEGNNGYQPLVEIKKKSGHKRLDEVQGLRGVAILAVLLFHLWPNKFKAGFLGVDIFFVISGYLMCMLLARQRPLGFWHVWDFYFRRLKRIFPTYLFVILIVLSNALIFLAPSDFKNLWEEAWKPLMVMANVPDTGDKDYFAQDQGHYSFFLHLWSLSVELQFYLFVPFLVFVLHRIPSKLQWTFLISLALLSFVAQLGMSKDQEHMSLAGRVWQFMFGFLAHYLGELEVTDLTGQIGQIGQGKCQRIANIFLPLFLIASTLFQFTAIKAINRLVTTALSMFIIARSSKCCFLGAPWLVYLGDISYSVYLIHWPLFEYYKYTNVQAFAFLGGTQVVAGLLLLVIFHIFGQLIEELFKWVGKWIVGWKSLLFIIFMFYALNFVALNQLEERAIDVEVNMKVPLKNAEKVWKKANEFYEHFDEPEKVLNVEESIEWSNGFYQAIAQPTYCHSKKVSTKFKPRREMGRLADLACVWRGNGTKHIVVVGNSHAQAYFPGVLHHFGKDIKEATLMLKNGCNYVGVREDDRNARVCQKERHSLLPVLRQWKYPIDIIIFGHAYTSVRDAPIDGNVKEDPIFKEMQQIFANLSEIAREVLFVPTVQFDNGLETYMSVLRREFLMEGNLEVFRTPIGHTLNHRPNTRRRIAAIECENCVKLDFNELWCRESEKLCETVDQERRVAFFHDRHHPNYYGSFFVGQFIRQKYDEFMRERNERMESESERNKENKE